MRLRVMPGSASLLCLSTAHFCSRYSWPGISERRGSGFLLRTKRRLPMPDISNARVLIVATSGFEEWELFGPRQILQQRGAEVALASLTRDPIQATVHDDPGKTIRP